MRDDSSGWSSVPNWVIRSEKLHGTEKWVYITLLNRANANGECWPSLSTLQKEVGVSKNTILKSLKSLESKGLIDRVRRRSDGVEFASNLYRIHAWQGSSETALGGSKENQGVVQPLNKGGSNEDQEVLPIEVLPNRSTTQGGNRAETAPSPFCKRHQETDGTDRACTGCKQARQAFDAAQKRVEAAALRPPSVRDLFCPEHPGYPPNDCDRCKGGA